MADQGNDMVDRDSGGDEVETYNALGETLTVEAETSGALKSYALSTTASAQGTTIPGRNVVELSDAPRSRTESIVFDAMFAMAVEEARENSVETITDGAFNEGQGLACSCFETGEAWNYVWTRDIGYAVDLGLGWIDPARAQRSLEFKVSGLHVEPTIPQIVQDTGTGGSWPVSSDRVVWAVGARTVLSHLTGQPRADFAELSYQAVARTIDVDRRAVYDPATGLYRGETSFLDWREQTYSLWSANNFNALAGSLSLSTNLAHLSAIEFAAELATQAGAEAKAQTYTGWAQALRSTIAQRFWSDDAGMPVSYLMTEFGAVKPQRFDALAIARAGLMGIEFPSSGLAAYPHSEWGPPAVSPQLPGVPIYHNRAIWPFVTAYTMLAASRERETLVADHAFESLIRGAAIYLSNMENFEYTTQRPWVDDGDLSGPVVNSKRQLWSVAGYVGAVIEGLYGLHAGPDSLRVDPVVGPGARAWLGEAPRLENLTLWGKKIHVQLTFSGEGEAWVAGQIRLDGVDVNSPVLAASIKDGSEIVVVMKALESAGLGPRISTETAAPEPTISVEPDASGVRITVVAEQPVDIFRDGVEVASGVTDAWLDEDVAAGLSPCYTVVSGGSSPAEARCGWGEESERRVQTNGSASFHVLGGYWGESNGIKHWVDWGGVDHLLRSPLRVATHTGEHWFQWRYANGAGPLNTGISAATKDMMVFSESGTLLAQRVISFPHTTTWDDWQDSQVLKVDLVAGQTYFVLLSEFQNMTYFDHFNTYTAGAGGGPDVYNRVNVAALKTLVKNGTYDSSIGTGVALNGASDLDAFATGQSVAPGVEAATGDMFALDWDGEYVYVAVKSGSFANTYTPFMLYIESRSGAAWGPPIASQGMEYGGQKPFLPFSPDFAISLRGLNDDDSNTGPWNGLWGQAAGDFLRAYRLAAEDWWFEESSQTLSFRAPRSVFGDAARVAGHVVNGEVGQEWKGTIPASHTPWAVGPGFYEIDLEGAHGSANWTVR